MKEKREKTNLEIINQELGGKKLILEKRSRIWLMHLRLPTDVFRVHEMKIGQ